MWSPGPCSLLGNLFCQHTGLPVYHPASVSKWCPVCQAAFHFPLSYCMDLVHITTLSVLDNVNSLSLYIFCSWSCDFQLIFLLTNSSLCKMCTWLCSWCKILQWLSIPFSFRASAWLTYLVVASHPAVIHYSSTWSSTLKKQNNFFSSIALWFLHSHVRFTYTVPSVGTLFPQLPMPTSPSCSNPNLKADRQPFPDPTGQRSSTYHIFFWTLHKLCLPLQEKRCVQVHWWASKSPARRSDS